MEGDVYSAYAFTWADCPMETLGRGVDPRFPVELLPCGRLAALASRLGLDQFDLAGLEAQTADIAWLSRVALRHNEIIVEAARWRPVLPLRMGAIFRSRDSLMARLAESGPVVGEFLAGLGDREEWAAKLYFDAQHAEQTAEDLEPSATASARGVGAQYLARKRHREQARRAVQEDCQREVAEIETTLGGRAERCCRVRVLPASLTGRREKMLWNAAFLVSRTASESWQQRVERLSRCLAGKGLLLEATGPWPPYHFCPELT